MFVRTGLSFEDKRLLLRQLNDSLSHLWEERGDGRGEAATMMMCLGPLAVNCPELRREVVTAMVINYKTFELPNEQLLNVVRCVARWVNDDLFIH